jgi:hypothetical protein
VNPLLGNRSDKTEEILPNNELPFRNEANLETTKAHLYEESKRTGLGEEFLEHPDTYFERIITNPKHFPQKRKPYREAFMKRFRYLIVYEIKKM